VSYIEEDVGMEKAKTQMPVTMMSAAPKNGAPLPPKRVKSQQQLQQLKPVLQSENPFSHLEVTSPSSKVLSSTVAVRKVSASRARHAAMTSDNRKQYIAVSAAKSPVKSPMRQGSALHALQTKEVANSNAVDAAYSDDEDADAPPTFEIEEGVYDSDNSL